MQVTPWPIELRGWNRSDYIYIGNSWKSYCLSSSPRETWSRKCSYLEIYAESRTVQFVHVPSGSFLRASVTPVGTGSPPMSLSPLFPFLCLSLYLNSVPLCSQSSFISKLPPDLYISSQWTSVTRTNCSFTDTGLSLSIVLMHPYTWWLSIFQRQGWGRLKGWRGQRKLDWELPWAGEDGADKSCKRAQNLVYKAVILTRDCSKQATTPHLIPIVFINIMLY